MIIIIISSSGSNTISISNVLFQLLLLLLIFELRLFLGIDEMFQGLVNKMLEKQTRNHHKYLIIISYILKQL